MDIHLQGRHKTVVLIARGVAVSGGALIVLQSMANIDTADRARRKCPGK